MNGCAPGVTLIERLKATRKWAIRRNWLRVKWPRGDWAGFSSWFSFALSSASEPVQRLVGIIILANIFVRIQGHL